MELGNRLNQPTLTVAAVPCLNTERFIADVVSRARKYVDQVVVIDDGSRDGTVEAARAAGALVISHKRNFSKGTAYPFVKQKLYFLVYP